MRAPSFDIVQDLLITSASTDGAWVEVEGVGPSGRRERIRIRLASAQAAAERLATLRAWQDQRVPVTYVGSPSGAALIDEREVFDRATSG
jgi:hypothetical protein